jgi:hypothetical protein
MTARFRSILRALALVLYLLCYAIVGTVCSWIAGLILLAAIGLTNFDSPREEQMMLGICAGGFVLGLCVAWRSRRNWIAHGSMIAFGGVNAIAGIVVGNRLLEQAQTAQTASSGLVQTIAAIFMYAFAILGAVSLLGGVCGLVFGALSSKSHTQPPTSESRPLAA